MASSCLKSIKRHAFLIIGFFLSLGLITSCLPVPSVQAQSKLGPPFIEPPDLASAGAILIDADTGQVLYEKQADRPFYPASITKILTAIVAIENGRLDELVTVSEEATRVDGTRVYLVPGEQKTLRELLYAMMVNSGNDAAVAIAEHIGGSVEAFARLMNQKANDLGATNSHFVNPSGLHDDNQYTTARDMAKIAQYAMRSPIFREIVATKTMPWNGDGWKSQLVNHNKLLWQYEGATGIKNGYTSKAKQTFVATAKKGESQLIAVCLSAPTQSQMYHDLKALMDYGFEAFQPIPVVSETEQFLERDRSQEIALRTGREIRIQRPVAEASAEEELSITKQVILEPLQYPIHKGQQVGLLNIALGNRSAIQVPLYAAEAISPSENGKKDNAYSSVPFFWFGVTVAALGILSFIHYRRQRLPRRWRYYAQRSVQSKPPSSS